MSCALCLGCSNFGPWSINCHRKVIGARSWPVFNRADLVAPGRYDLSGRLRWSIGLVTL